MVKTIMANLTDAEYSILKDILDHANCDKEEIEIFNSMMKKIEPIGYYDDSDVYKS